MNTLRTLSQKHATGELSTEEYRHLRHELLDGIEAGRLPIHPVPPRPPPSEGHDLLDESRALLDELGRDTPLPARRYGLGTIIPLGLAALLVLGWLILAPGRPRPTVPSATAPASASPRGVPTSRPAPASRLPEATALLERLIEAEDWRETQIQTFLYAWGQLPEAVRSEAADTLPFRRVTDRIRAQALEAKALAGLQQFSLQSGSLKRLHLLAEALHLGEESALLSQLDADSQAGNQGRAAPEAAEADRPMDRGGDRARDRRPRDAGAKGTPPPPAPAVGLLTSPAAASLATRNRTTDPETAPPGLAPAFADESGPAPAGQAASSRPELTPAGQGPKKGTKAKLKDQAKDTMAGAKATGDAAAPAFAPAPLHASPAKPGAKGTGGIGSGGAGVPGDTPRASPRSTADDSDTHLTAPSAKTRPKDKAGKEKAGKTPDPRLEKEPKGLIDHGDRWLAGQDGKKFTVQLVSLQRLDKILHLLIAHPEVDAKIVRNPGHAGGGGYRILMGAYASLDEAKRAIAQLPEPLRRAFGTPLVRPVASLRPTTTAAARRPAE